MLFAVVIEQNKVKEILVFSFFLFLVSITPLIKIYLPFTSIHFVMQNILFLIYAAAKIGCLFFIFPTVGYILGYFISSYFVEYWFEKKQNTHDFITVVLFFIFLKKVRKNEKNYCP